jgi:hypothetical protein
MMMRNKAKMREAAPVRKVGYIGKVLIATDTPANRGPVFLADDETTPRPKRRRTLQTNEADAPYPKPRRRVPKPTQP